jgi:hypothetical protein
MKNVRFLILFSVFIVFSFSACPTGDYDEPDRLPDISPYPDPVTVFSVGFYNAGGRTVACYWQNGARKSLDASGLPGSSQAVAITVSRTNVYVAGNYDTGISIGGGKTKWNACYWVNGQRKNLNVTGIPGTGSSYCTGITVSGNDVYISGYGDSIDNPCGFYWKNETRYDLGQKIYPSSIAVTGDTVYTAGEAFFPGTANWGAASWENTTTQWNLGYNTLSDESSVNTIAISESGDRIVLTGYVYTADPWALITFSRTKQTEYSLILHDLPSNGVYAWPISSCIYNGKVYTGGNYYNSVTDTNIACYWEDNAFNALNIPAIAIYSEAQSITVANNKVYTGGAYATGAELYSCFWENSNITSYLVNDAGADIQSTYVVIR